ncbi:hypothetical protein PILCRDRAFT_200711 [Piloderma croceum F 1598]|uniref:Uncharacterized protein n=1 Tax=Piloderma croceum (strain F 1598) TaxID=765440 RepID=A0A0C3G0Y8_PILCF|nr:hypothetical protein PILCRDRAFT_200711 [Piloderma croceum F 1598]
MSPCTFWYVKLSPPLDDARSILWPIRHRRIISTPSKYQYNTRSFLIACQSCLCRFGSIHVPGNSVELEHWAMGVHDCRSHRQLAGRAEEDETIDANGTTVSSGRRLKPCSPGRHVEKCTTA